MCVYLCPYSILLMKRKEILQTPEGCRMFPGLKQKLCDRSCSVPGSLNSRCNIWSVFSACCPGQISTHAKYAEICAIQQLNYWGRTKSWEIQENRFSPPLSLNKCGINKAAHFAPISVHRQDENLSYKYKPYKYCLRGKLVCLLRTRICHHFLA